MSGSRIKKMRKEARAVYEETEKQSHKKILPFKSIFRQIKKLSRAGEPVYKQTRAARGVSWPTNK